MQTTYSSQITTKDGRTIRVREAERVDAGDLLAYVDAISYESTFLTFGPGEFSLSLEEEEAFLESCRASASCLYLLALLEGVIVGAITFRAGTRKKVRHAGEMGISVRREYWGQGIASGLLDALLEWAQAGGTITKINLRVRADNERAIALYEHKGFFQEGRLSSEILIEGVYYDNLWMGFKVRASPKEQAAAIAGWSRVVGSYNSTK